MSDTPFFILYSRSWCHLCEDMLAALRALAGDGWRVDVVDVDADPELVERYDELVPVLLGCRPGQPPTRLCHYYLDGNAVLAFLGAAVPEPGLLSPESGKMRG